MNAELQNTIKQVIENGKGQNASATIEFQWNGETWCVFGKTQSGLSWESDNFEADSIEQAEADAVYYLLNS